MGGGPQAEEGNHLARAMVRRLIACVAAGATVIIGRPLFSHLWMLDELLGLIGALGFSLVRIGQRMLCGTHYQKPQLWLTKVTSLCALGCRCAHRSHEANLSGGHWVEQTASYPCGLATPIVDAVTSDLDSRGRVGSARAVTTTQTYLDARVEQAPRRMRSTNPTFCQLGAHGG